MRLSIVSSFALLGALAAASPQSTHVLHERREHLDAVWTKRSQANGAAVVPVRIGMSQSNLEKGHDLLMEVADHVSPKFGKHYTEEEINEVFAPSKETVKAVGGWLEAAGIAKDRISQSFNKQWLQFDSTVSELEDLLKTKYHVFQHDNGNNHVACDEYHIPNYLKPHVDYITPGILLTPAPAKNDLRKRDAEKIQKRKAKKGFVPDLRPRHFPLHIEEPSSEMVTKVRSNIASGNLALCDAVITPDCIRAMYKVPKTFNSSKTHVMGVFEDLGDHYSQTDLNLFFENIDGGNIPQGTHPKCQGIDGAFCGTDVKAAGLESDLDFQISYPLIHPSKSVLFQTDDQHYEANYTFSGFLNNFFYGIDGSYCTNKAFGAKVPSPLDPPYPDPAKGGYKGEKQCGVYEPTNVISISYGGAEIGLPVNYQKRQCHEIMKLGMRGITVIVSSGDDGVASFPNSVSPNGCLPIGANNGTIFTPDFPATCPYITSLGSTYLPPGADPKTDLEVPTTRFSSGGGFSNIYLPASYQKKAQQSYLDNFTPSYPFYKTQDTNGRGVEKLGGLYNAKGRGFPDFAAVGDNILIYGNGRPLTIGGTSASTPAFAALIARINEERQNVGKSTVGFVNPTLYANPDVFNDVTTGDNPGCGVDGFKAAPGWDPVTGLGTPNFQKMLDLFMSMP